MHFATSCLPASLRPESNAVQSLAVVWHEVAAIWHICASPVSSHDSLSACLPQSYALVERHICALVMPSMQLMAAEATFASMYVRYVSQRCRMNARVGQLASMWSREHSGTPIESVSRQPSVGGAIPVDGGGDPSVVPMGGGGVIVPSVDGPVRPFVLGSVLGGGR